MGTPQADTQPGSGRLGDLIRMIFTVQEDDITCDECFDHIDQYVELLNAGQEPAQVLPQVKHHLEQCQCCEQEFRALIAILENQPQALPGDETG